VKRREEKRREKEEQKREKREKMEKSRKLLSEGECSRGIRGEGDY